MSHSTTSDKRRGTFVAEVRANETICDDHGRIVLGLPSFPATEPGQFVQLLCRSMSEPERPQAVEWAVGEVPRFCQQEFVGRVPLLRRPFSVGGRRDGADGVELDMIYSVKGVGTRWLADVQPGQQLSVLGPLGNSFAIHRDKPEAVLVGGGVGIPPLLYLAEALSAAGKQTTAFVGARTINRLPLQLIPGNAPCADGSPSPCAAELAALGVDTAIATDDGSGGLSGVVTETLDKWLKAQDPSKLVIYSCGPEIMMQAVAYMAAAAGADCQLSLERYMACGM
ncbi:MAG: ferredoxin reductase domain-containing protein, partial [Planctomycetota bacterium]